MDSPFHVEAAVGGMQLGLAHWVGVVEAEASQVVRWGWCVVWNGAFELLMGET